MVHDVKEDTQDSRTQVLDCLLVEGELVTDAQGREVRVFPKSVEIAQRLGVTPSYVSKYAKNNRCFQRRRELLVRAQAEARDELAKREGKRLAFNSERVIQLVDDVLEAYAKSVQEDGVSRPTASDINTMVRLRQYLDGDADNRQEVMGGLTLEAIQSAHRQMLDDMQRATPAECGVVDAGLILPAKVPRASPIETVDESGQVDEES